MSHTMIDPCADCGYPHACSDCPCPPTSGLQVPCTVRWCDHYENALHNIGARRDDDIFHSAPVGEVEGIDIGSAQVSVVQLEDAETSSLSEPTVRLTSDAYLTNEQAGALILLLARARELSRTPEQVVAALAGAL